LGSLAGVIESKITKNVKKHVHCWRNSGEVVGEFIHVWWI
jgi:hypothetical protein